jgi:LuxR family transcriptional regulator, maltose regulon positive regulatory protein
MDGTVASRHVHLERMLSRTGVVHRGALMKRLSSAPAGSVALVCAPAGSGKSVLVRTWADAVGEQVAWIAVEAGEQDPQRFWLAVIDALAEAAGRSDLAVRTGPTPYFRGSAAVDRLLEGLDTVEDPLVLVIDDLHELDSDRALEWLELFIADIPESMRLVLTSREEPRLDLNGVRLTGELTELRAADLRFTRDETRELLASSGIELSDEALELLHDRTEGWVAGLRLAEISLAEHPDPEVFVREFSGTERTVAGYLVNEVLERQRPEIRDLLLKTSVLDRVSGPLADHLTGGSGSERALQDLEEANAFVTSLDAGRTWFRFHHLFADFLRMELRRTDPASIQALRAKAARWYEEHGYPVEAIRHAQAAEDWAYAARLLVDSYVSLVLDGRLDTVRALLGAFPPRAPSEDPELAVAFAGARLFEGRTDETAAYIELADQLSAEVPEDRRWHFDLRVASTKLWLARRRVDLRAALETMRSVEASLAERPPSGVMRAADHRAAALMNLGIAELWTMQIESGRRHLEEALAMTRQIGRPYLEIACLGHLAIAEPLGGASVLDGVEVAEEAISTAQAHGWAEDSVIAPALALGGVALLWLGRFDEAARRLERAESLLRSETEPMTELAVRWAVGLLRSARGRLDEALAALREAQSVRSSLPEQMETIEPASAILHVQVRLGATADARDALMGMSDRVRDRALYRIASAAILLAEENPEAALEALAPVIEGDAAVSHPLTASIDALLWAAAAHDQLGDSRATEESIERALELAEPQGIIIPFALAPVRELLERHPGHRTSHAGFLSEILDVLAGSSPAALKDAAPLREELSEAELRIVRFLPTNLKAPEIATELFVSPNTVRTHLRHIYAKLDAHSRSEAVDRARELGLLGPSRLL